MDISTDPPAKRRRLSNSSVLVGRVASLNPSTDEAPTTQPDLTEAKRQHDVGIQEFVTPDVSRFNAVLKKRYTDFLVNEILPNGEVVHLRNLKAPKKESPKIEARAVQPPSTVESLNTPDQSAEPAASSKKSPEPQNGPRDVLPDVTESDRERLVGYFNEAAVAEMLSLYEGIRAKPGKKSADHPVVRTDFTADRSLRSQIHQAIRDIFKSSIDSSTDHDGILVLTAAKPINRSKHGNARHGLQFKNQRPGKLGWLERGGEHLHFTLLKENKDTMEVVSFLTKQMKCNAKSFQFAGTKDRRAVTTQRCSAYRIEVEKLEAQNRTLRGSKIGDFKYCQNGLELGDLLGNEFVITLRNVRLQDHEEHIPDLSSLTTDMQQRMQSLRDNGYLNYFGLQRFGTFTVTTDVIGRDILKGDYQAACDDILSFSEEAAEAAKQDTDSKIGQDDRNRSLAIMQWRQNGRINSALDILPRKFSAEAQLIRHLSKHPNDHYGALLTIQRNLRLMYVHAYQSLVWNMATSHRIKTYGNKTVKGDLVLVNDHKEKEPRSETNQHLTLDADGEQIITPADHDRAAQEDDVFERARALTDEEAKSGQYTIFDVVLPLPGYDIVYPDNDTGRFYRTFMSSPAGGELDADNMRRKHREFSLSGSYRKIVERIGEDFEVQAHKYDKDEEQFVTTDLDLLHNEESLSNTNTGNRMNKGDDKVPPGDELNKERGGRVAVVLKFQLGSSQYATMALRELSRNGIEQHKPDFSGGR